MPTAADYLHIAAQLQVLSNEVGESVRSVRRSAEGGPMIGPTPNQILREVVEECGELGTSAQRMLLEAAAEAKARAATCLAFEQEMADCTERLGRTEHPSQYPAWVYT